MARASVFVSTLVVLAALLLQAQSREIKGKYITVTVGDRVFDVTQFKARGDGRTDDSAAIQRALDAAKGAGGGVVVIPKGKTFLIKGINIIGDRTELRLDGNLLVSNDWAHWPADVKAVVTIGAKNNVAITGKGTIDGQGAVWWANRRYQFRPRTIYPRKTDRVIVTGVTIKDCPDHCMQMYSSNTEIFGITLRAPPSEGIAKPSHNTDGIDIHGENFYVHNSDISVGDDNVAIHASKVRVEDCEFGNGHGASIGSLCTEVISDIVVRNVHFSGTTCGARIKTIPNCGGSLSNVFFQDLVMDNVKKSIHISMDYKLSTPKPASNLKFKISNVNLLNIRSNNPQQAGEFVCDPKSPCNVVMRDVVQTGNKLAYKCSFAIGKATGKQSPRPCIAARAGPGAEDEGNFTGEDPIDVPFPQNDTDFEDDGREGVFEEGSTDKGSGSSALSALAGAVFAAISVLCWF
eukprot:m51a1_g7578 putative polygalacturonase (462) ;mRNA; f:185262-186731